MGANIYNSTTGTMGAKSFATGQDTPYDSGPVSWTMLFPVTDTSDQFQIRVYRDSGQLIVGAPASTANVGYAISATIVMVS